MKKVKSDPKIVSLHQEVDNLKGQLARALADYANLEKRIERQSTELYASVSSRIVRRLLPILDMLQEAQKHVADPGIAITIKEFTDVLSEEGYTPINPSEGATFDEQFHEAIEVIETEDQNEDNTIAQVSLSGWQVIDGPVIRHAKVVVKKFPEHKEEKEKKDNE